MSSVVTIENLTGSEYEIRASGQSLDSGEVRTINPKAYDAFSEGVNGNDPDLIAKITAGTIVIAVNGTDLQYQIALRLLSSFDFQIIQENGVFKTASSNFNFTGNVSVTPNETTGVTEVNFGNANVIGGILQLAFTEDGSSDDEWLGLYDRGLKSDETFGIIPFDCRLVSMTFSNSRSGADCDIEIWQSDAGAGSTSQEVYNWPIVNKRIECISTFSPNIDFSAGDKIGIFCRDQGTNPSNTAVVLYFQILNTNTCNGGENFSGDFDAGEPGG